MILVQLALLIVMAMHGEGKGRATRPVCWTRRVDASSKRVFSRGGDRAIKRKGANWRWSRDDNYVVGFVRDIAPAALIW